MITLTDTQRRVMLQLGDTESAFEMVPSDIMDDLIELRLVYTRPDGNLDFTDAGEDVYRELTRKSEL